jgi:hypothetical protein
MAMPLFRCLIRGEGFPAALLGDQGPVGFYTTRFVEAETADVAELAAIDVLRRDPTFAVDERHRTSDAKVFVEEIEEVPAETERRPDAGFTFFVGD